MLTVIRSLKISPPVRYWVETLLGPYPGLFFPLYRLRRQYVGHVVQPDTDLVIEGFPRSGNTFALDAFTLAQGRRPVKIAHHVNAPAQVIRAAHLGIPCCVLIRNPVDAVRSLLVRYPYITARSALKNYARFHRSIYPCRDNFVVAPFDKVVSNFGTVIREINARFSTSFETFDLTDRNLRAVYAMLDRRNEDIGGDPRMSYRPNEIKEALKQKISLEDCRHALAECNEIYRVFNQLSSA